MTARDFFCDSSGAIRPPWRLLAFGVATVASLVVLEGAVAPLVSRLAAAAGTRVVIYPWVLVGALLAGHALTFAWVERGHGWQKARLGRSAVRPRSIALGAGLGAAAIAVPCATLVAVDWLQVDQATEGSSFAVALAMGAFLAPAAFAEELLFRGYPFAVLAEWWGPPAALIVTSVAFGLVHLSNAGASPGAIAVVVLAGIFLGAVLLATGSLYAAFAAHLAWNWVLAAVLHASVSGIPFPTPDYRVVDAGPDWATGGVWGPEGGAAAAVGLLSAVTYLYARRGRRGER